MWAKKKNFNLICHNSRKEKRSDRDGETLRKSYLLFS